MVLWFFRHCLDGLIRPVFSTLCQWWRWCRDAWTWWCQSQTTRTDLHSREGSLTGPFNVQNQRFSDPCQKVQDSSEKMQRCLWVQELHTLQVACMNEWIFISQKFSDHYIISHASIHRVGFPIHLILHKSFNIDIYISFVLPAVRDSFVQGLYFWFRVLKVQ